METRSDSLTDWSGSSQMLMAPDVSAGEVGFGRPVIASDVGGPKERIRHDEDGLLFAVGDPRALADTIRRACTEEGLWDRLHAGIRLAPSREEMVDGYLAVYAEPPAVVAEVARQVAAAPFAMTAGTDVAVSEIADIGDLDPETFLAQLAPRVEPVRYAPVTAPAEMAAGSVVVVEAEADLIAVEETRVATVDFDEVPPAAAPTGAAAPAKKGKGGRSRRGRG